MDENTSLINIGELSRPATVLIEKISNAVGGIFKPYQLVRIAKAEAQAERVRAEGGSRPIDRFVDYVTGIWESKRYMVIDPLHPPQESDTSRDEQSQ